MNNTTIMSVLKQRDLFTVQCMYSTQKEVMNEVGFHVDVCRPAG